MKLLMVSNFFESHRGGLELIAGRLVRELVRLGADVRWLASNVTPPAADEVLSGRTVAVKMANMSERHFGIPYPVPTPRAIWRIGCEVRRSDAVLLQDSLYLVCVAAFLLARVWGKPVVIAQHVGIVPYRNPLFRGLMALLNRFIARPMLARADRVAFFSEITARYFADLQRQPRAGLMFTGVDTDIFHPAHSADRPALRRRLGLRPDRPVALFVGRFVEKKGLQFLSAMARQRPDIQWAFAGWGHLNPEAWALPNVAVFRGLSGAELVPLYQACDVFVLPSKGEGFPLVIQEALACGLPVVCSAENATADAAVASLLYPVPLDEAEPAATASAFCRQIDRLLASRDAESPLPQQRFQFVSRRYSWSALGSEYLDLIHAAVRDKERTARRPAVAAGRARQAAFFFRRRRP
jgi:alpha-maltose-1-phosphate synthase